MSGGLDDILSVLTRAVLSVWELGVIHCQCSWYRPVLVLIVTPEPEPSGGRGVFLVAGGGGGRTDPDISRYNWLPASAPLPQLPAPLAAVTLPPQLMSTLYTGSWGNPETNIRDSFYT